MSSNILRSFTCQLTSSTVVTLQWQISDMSYIGGYKVLRALVNDSVYTTIANLQPT